MRLNHHEEEVYGSRTAPAAVIASTTPGGAPASTDKRHAGCPRFGHHSADAHRESEIVGGAFQHEHD